MAGADEGAVGGAVGAVGGAVEGAAVGDSSGRLAGCGQDRLLRLLGGSAGLGRFRFAGQRADDGGAGAAEQQERQRHRAEDHGDPAGGSGPAEPVRSGRLVERRRVRRPRVLWWLHRHGDECRRKHTLQYPPSRSSPAPFASRERSVGALAGDESAGTADLQVGGAGPIVRVSALTKAADHHALNRQRVGCRTATTELSRCRQRGGLTAPPSPTASRNRSAGRGTGTAVERLRPEHARARQAPLASSSSATTGLTAVCQTTACAPYSAHRPLVVDDVVQVDLARG